MRKRTSGTILAVLVILSSWCPAHAYLMNVISQEYSIEGRVEFYPFPEIPGWGDARFIRYQEMSSSPVSRTIDWRTPTVPYTGYAYLETTAAGGVTGTGAWLHTFGLAIDSDHGETYAQGLTSAAITFSPLVTSFVATINERNTSWPPEEGVGTAVALFDLTSNSSLLPPRSNPYWQSPEPIALSLDLSHTYRMRIEFPVAPSSTPYEYSLDLRGHPVPEPSTLLLLATGLVGLGGMAWRRHRRG